MRSCFEKSAVGIRHRVERHDSKARWLLGVFGLFEG